MQANTDNLPVTSTEQLTALLDANLALNINTVIVGPPGCGKSEITAQRAAMIGTVELWHPTTMEPTDVTGLPMFTDGRATFAPFERLAKLCDDGDGTPITVILEELGSSVLAIQNVLMHVVQAREIGGHAMSRRVRFVATTNDRSHRSGAIGVHEALKDRFMVIKFEPSIDGWVMHAIDRGVDNLLIAFVRWTWIETFKVWQPTNTMEPTATLRGVVDRCDKIRKNIDAYPSDVRELAYAGSIGSAAAKRLLAYEMMADDLPDVAAILADPDSAPVPDTDRPDMRYAITSALAFAANDDRLFDRAMRFVDRFSDHAREYRMVLCLEGHRRHPAIAASRAYRAWCASEGREILGAAGSNMFAS